MPAALTSTSTPTPRSARSRPCGTFPSPRRLRVRSPRPIARPCRWRGLTICSAPTSSPPTRCCCKIDVQGFEFEVLAGAMASLPRVEAILIEVSLVPMHQDEPALPRHARPPARTRLPRRVLLLGDGPPRLGRGWPYNASRAPPPVARTPRHVGDSHERRRHRLPRLEPRARRRLRAGAGVRPEAGAGVARRHRASRRHRPRGAARRLLLWRLPALRRHRRARRRSWRRCAPMPPAAAWCSASATASRSCARPACCRAC